MDLPECETLKKLYVECREAEIVTQVKLNPDSTKCIKQILDLDDCLVRAKKVRVQEGLKKIAHALG